MLISAADSQSELSLGISDTPSQHTSLIVGPLREMLLQAILFLMENPNEHRKKEFGSPVAGVGLAIFIFGLVAYFVWHIFHGTDYQRIKSIFIIVGSVVAVLIYFNIIKEKWVNRAGWLAYAAMCVGGPIFTIYLVGRFLGWW